MTKINLFQGSSNEENIPFPGGAALEEKKNFSRGESSIKENTPFRTPFKFDQNRAKGGPQQK